MSLTVSTSFTSATSGASLYTVQGDTITYSITGTFVGTWVLESSVNALSPWVIQATGTSTSSGAVVSCCANGSKLYWRFRCSAYTSGTMVTSVVRTDALLKEYRDRDGTLIWAVNEGGVSAVVRTAQTRVLAAGAKVGTTAGWVVGAANNIGRMATCPASQTASTLVVPIQGLKVGDTITGFYGIGQIESAGGIATLDIELRKLTSAAADLTDATVGAITQLSVTADTIVSSTNAVKASLSDTVGADETFYFLVTATTAAATDVDLQGLAITVTEA